jgi:hypothetical protein
VRPRGAKPRDVARRERTLVRVVAGVRGPVAELRPDRERSLSCGRCRQAGEGRDCGCYDDVSLHDPRVLRPVELVSRVRWRSGVRRSERPRRKRVAGETRTA